MLDAVADGPLIASDVAFLKQESWVIECRDAYLTVEMPCFTAVEMRERDIDFSWSIAAAQISSSG